MSSLGATGHLIVIHGPMFSGKTTTMFGKLEAYTALGKRVAYVNSPLDSRGVAFSSHNDSLIRTGRIDYLKEVPSVSSLDRYDIIGIDEAQFLGREMIEVVLSLVEKRHKIVVVAGLLLDVRRERFGHMVELLPLADEVIALHGFCSDCARENKCERSLFTYRTDTSLSGVIAVGGSDKYVALCRSHYAMREEYDREQKRLRESAAREELINSLVDDFFGGSVKQ